MSKLTKTNQQKTRAKIYIPRITLAMEILDVPRIILAKEILDVPRIILAMEIIDVPLVRIQFPINGDISATTSTLKRLTLWQYINNSILCVINDMVMPTHTLSDNDIALYQLSLKI